MPGLRSLGIARAQTTHAYHRIRALVRNEPIRATLTISMAAHAAMLAVVLGPHRSSPQVIPVSVVVIPQWEGLGGLALQPDATSQLFKPEIQPGLPRHATQFVKGGRLTESPMRFAQADNRNKFSKTREIEAKPKQPNLIPSRASHRSEQYAAAPAISERRHSVEQPGLEKPRLTVTGHSDWLDNPVEDKKLTYSAPGAGVRLTVREASSAGFVSTNFNRDVRPNNDRAAEPFGLAMSELPTNAAISQKLDWTVVDSKNFGMTVFSYQNQVGSGFKPFGETKSEFTTAGTRMAKVGGQVRVGAVGFGFAQSSANTEDPRVNSFATQNEASVTLALSQLLPDMEGSVSQLLPASLWASASDKRLGASETTSTSFGGAWNWNSGYTTLSYWNYASGNSSSLGAAWIGQGFDANLGMYRSSFGINLNLSYGRSEDASGSWQSAGALHSSSVTVSYKPEKLPALWLTAAWGNYDHNEVTNSGTFSDLYLMSAKGAYTSLTAALDLTNWLWANQTKTLTGELSTVKLLYRYSENAFSDSATATRKDGNSLVAVMTQGKF